MSHNVSKILWETYGKNGFCKYLIHCCVQPFPKNKYWQMAYYIYDSDYIYHYFVFDTLYPTFITAGTKH